MNDKEFKDYVDKIPNMSPTEYMEPIRERIENTCKNLNDNQSIVELGCWLGFITCHILYYLNKYNKNNPVYTYDNFKIKDSEQEKAKNQNLNIDSYKSSLPIVKNFIKPFNYKNLHFIKASLDKIKSFKGQEIGFLIDDATKGNPAWDVSLNVFHPKLADGAIVYLMDYYFFKISTKERHKRQMLYIENNPHYEFLEHFDEGVFFRYRKNIE